jgi:putative ABC transport system permease protein
MGIRTALGASAVELLLLVFKHGLWLTSIGLAVGFAGAFALTRLLASILYNVATFDPYTIVITAAILFSVAFTACLVPALRATRVDPTLALRGE